MPDDTTLARWLSEVEASSLAPSTKRSYEDIVKLYHRWLDGTYVVPTNGGR